MSRVQADYVRYSGTKESLERALRALQRFDLSYDVRVESADYTVDFFDDIVEADTAAVTITLPPTADAQRKPYWVVNSSAGNITIALNGSDTAVNWTASLTLGANGVAMFVHNNDGESSTAGWYRLV